jgi:hypothetical protein
MKDLVNGVLRYLLVSIPRTSQDALGANSHYDIHPRSACVLYQRPLVIMQRSVPITIGTLRSKIKSVPIIVNRRVVPTIGRTHKIGSSGLHVLKDSSIKARCQTIADRLFQIRYWDTQFGVKGTGKGCRGPIFFGGTGKDRWFPLRRSSGRVGRERLAVLS